MYGDLTWEQMKQLDPRLQTLENKVKAVAQSYTEDEADLAWYNELKDDMSECVGTWRNHPSYPQLATQQAYDMAYRVLYYGILCGEMSAYTTRKEAHGNV